MCLGMRIVYEREKKVLKVDQSAYISDMLKRFGMADAKPTATPLDVSTKLQKTSAGIQADSHLQMRFQRLVGSLLYAAQLTRPDIAFALSVLSKFNVNPSNEYWNAAKRVLRYLAGTCNMCLVYRDSTEKNVVGFCDADYADDRDDRKSISGYVFLLAGAAVTWNSKKQATVSCSTTEAEYVALSHAAREAQWLRMLTAELFGDDGAMVIMCDNKGAVDFSVSARHHVKLKHVDVKHHFVKDLVATEKLRIVKVATEDMVADGLTKALPRAKHEWCTSQMGLLQ